MAGKQKRKAKPAAWAITHNPELWTHYDPFKEDNVILEWSLADNYRTREQMAPGDRAVFWETGEHAGVARIGFVLDVREEPGSRWAGNNGKGHKAPFSGEFYFPPLPRKAYLPRSILMKNTAFQNCELVVAGPRSSQPPLRIEQKEWRVITAALRRLDEQLWHPTAGR